MSLVKWPVLVGKNVDISYTKLNIKGNDYEFVILKSTTNDVADVTELGQRLKFVPLNTEFGVYGSKDFTKILPPGGAVRSQLDMPALAKALRAADYVVKPEERELSKCYIDVPAYVNSLKPVQEPQVVQDDSEEPAVAGSQSDSDQGDLLEQVTDEVGSESSVVAQGDLSAALISLADGLAKPTQYVTARTVDQLRFSSDFVYYIDPAFYSLLRASGVDPEAIPALADDLFAAQFISPIGKNEASHRLAGDKSAALYYGNKVVTATDFNELAVRSKEEGKPIFLTQAPDSTNYSFANFAREAKAITKLRPITFHFENAITSAAVHSLVTPSSSDVKGFNRSEQEILRRLRLSRDLASDIEDIQVLRIPAEIKTSREFFQYVFSALGYQNKQVVEAIGDVNFSSTYSMFSGEPEGVDGSRKYGGLGPSVRDLRLVGVDGEVSEKSVEVYLTSAGQDGLNRNANIRAPKSIEEVCTFLSLPVSAFGSEQYYQRLSKLDAQIKVSVVNELIDGLPVDVADYASLSDNDVSKIVRSFNRAETEYGAFSRAYFRDRHDHSLSLGSAAAFITAAYMISKNINNNVTTNPSALIVDRWIDRVVDAKSAKYKDGTEYAPVEDESEGANYAVRVFNDRNVIRLASDVDLIVEPLKGTEQGVVLYTVEVDADGRMLGRAEELLETLRVQHEIKAAYLAGSGSIKDLVIHVRSKNYSSILNGELSAVSSVSSVSDINDNKDDLKGIKLHIADGAKEAIQLNAYITKTEDPFPLEKEQFIRFIQDYFADDINNQVAYQPRSRYGKQVTTYMVPTNIAPAIIEALNNLEAKVGDIGDYVMTQLDFTEQQMELFDPGQIDTIAMLMSNHDEKLATIIGNSTGTGKTRVLVALAIHAIKQGRTVDLVSKSRTLLESFVAEAHAVGVWDLFRPLVLSYSDKDTVIYKPNGEEVTYTDHNGVVYDQKEQYSLFVKVMQKSRDSLSKFFRGASDSQKPNVIMHTYTLGNRFPEPVPKKGKVAVKDINVEDYSTFEQTLKRDKVRTHAELIALIGRPLTNIADESHEQTGESSNTLRNKERSMGMLKALQVEVVDVFASATWASKANKMGPYRNVFGDRVDPNVMAKMVQTIGLPAQESIVETVTRMGQYVRLELPKKGIVYDTRTDFKGEAFYTEMNDRAAEVHLTMRKAKDVVAGALSSYREMLLEKYRGRTLHYTDGDGNTITEVIGGSSERISAGIAHLNFSSTATMFNRIFSIAQKLETGFIAENILSEIREGRAALISAELTGGTHVKRLMQKYSMPLFSAQEIADGAFENWLQETLSHEQGDSDMRLDLQFGCMPNTTSLLRRLFEDALAMDIVHEIQEPGKANKTLRSLRLDYMDWIPVLVKENLLSSNDATTFMSYVDAIRVNIRNLKALPFSPFDQLKEQLVGLRFGEFSGRDINLVKTESGFYAPAPRVQLAWNQGKGAIESFQRGELDCIAGSKSLFTGYNLNSTVDDPRPRTTVNIEPIMAAIDSEQLKGRTNRIGVVGDVRMLGLSTTDILDIIYTAKARKNGQSLNSLTGANAYSDIGGSSIELISTVGAKAIEQVFATSPELFTLLDIEFDQLVTEGRKAQTQEATVIMVLNQMTMLDTATKKQIISQIESEYRQLLNELKMEGLDPFKDRVLNIDAEVATVAKIRSGVKGNPFKGDVYAIELEGHALVGQSIKPSTVLREIGSALHRFAEHNYDTPAHRDFTEVAAETLHLQYAMMYQDMHMAIQSSADANGNYPSQQMSRLAKRLDMIDALATLLKDARVGAIVDTSAGRGVLVDLGGVPSAQTDFNDGFKRIRNNEFADHLAWTLTVVFPGDKESRTMSFDSWLRQGLSITNELFSKDHPIYKDFKIAAAEKHGYQRTKVVGLRGPMFSVTEVAMDVAKVHGQLIIGEPVSVRLKDGSMERVWSMPKSVVYTDLVTMPTRLANENPSELRNFVMNHARKRLSNTVFASIVPSYERQLSRAKDVYIEFGQTGPARLCVPGSRSIAYGAGIVRDLKIHEIGAVQRIMTSPFSRTDKKSHSMFAEFDPNDIYKVIKLLDHLDVPLFMSRDLTAAYRANIAPDDILAVAQPTGELEELMSEMELIINTGNKVTKKKGGRKKDEEEPIEDAVFTAVDESEEIDTATPSASKVEADTTAELLDFLSNMGNTR